MKNRRGFTLIELLVVIAIIAILAAILFPVFARAKAAAKQATCTQNLNSVGKAFRMYASDNDDCLPTNHSAANATLLAQAQLTARPTTAVPNPVAVSVNFVEALGNYLEKLEDARGRESIWTCPSSTNVVHPNIPANPLYGSAAVTYVMSYYMAEQTEGKVDDPSNTLLAREVDRKVNALLRPFPSSVTLPLNGNTNTPLECFPAQDGQGPNAFANLTTAAQQSSAGMRHSSGCIVLFVDGHVQYRAMSMLPAVQFDANTTRWFVGADAAAPGRVWITL